MPNLNFDAEKVSPIDTFEPVPAGPYQAFIAESDIKPNGPNAKDPEGSQLVLVWQIAGGKHDGRKVWDRLNLKNASPKAVEIAERTLSAICHAVGVLKPASSEELHDKICAITVKVDGEWNRVSGYKSLQEAQASQSAVQQEMKSNEEKAEKEAPF